LGTAPGVLLSPVPQPAWPSAFARTPIRVSQHTVRLCSQRSSRFRGPFLRIPADQRWRGPRSWTFKHEGRGIWTPRSASFPPWLRRGTGDEAPESSGGALSSRRSRLPQVSLGPATWLPSLILLKPKPFRYSRGAKCLANVWKRCTASHSVAEHCTCQQGGCQKPVNPLRASGVSV
jgi:hypothetical protein